MRRLQTYFRRHGIAQSERSTTIKIVLVEVGRSKRAYWGWSEQQWLTLINSAVQNDRTLLATAYLLSGFKRFYDVERNAHLLVTARLVFGRDVFDRECGRLMTALDRVGFKCRSMRSFMPSVIAAAALEGDDPRLERFDRRAPRTCPTSLPWADRQADHYADERSGGAWSRPTACPIPRLSSRAVVKNLATSTPNGWIGADVGCRRRLYARGRGKPPTMRCSGSGYGSQEHIRR